ncbi:hypothetical protein B0H14DRAFT_2494004 [Mycena olivaceomarginata]|nr:hypothetical protein B0H14DRAFT_2494004 [Mycena olivaceomarginata]
MPSPPIEVFLTTIASQPALRQRQEYVLRTLQVKKIPFTSYDLASDEKVILDRRSQQRSEEVPQAKRLWKRKAPIDKQQLPGILVGGRFPGPFQDFEDAVECADLDTFLRLKESWDPDIDGEGTKLTATPIGVPGAQTPLEMTPEHIRKQIIAQQTSPLRGKGGIPVNKRTDQFDAGTEFSGFGLQGVQVSEAELADLVAELGLEGDEAGDLLKGLSSATTPSVEKKEPKPPTKEAAAEIAPVAKPTEEAATEVVLPTEEAAPEVKAAEEVPIKASEESKEPESEPVAAAVETPVIEVKTPAKTEPESQPEPKED